MCGKREESLNRVTVFFSPITRSDPCSRHYREMLPCMRANELTETASAVSAIVIVSSH